jgi:hypothetical protein
MARLAFLTSLAPTATPDTGFEIANRAVIDGLRAQGHVVRVFAFARPDDVLAADPDLVLLGRMEIENQRVGAARKLGWVASALRRGLPVACAKLRVSGSGVIERIRADGPFDAIVASGATMIGAYSRVAELAPVLFVQHNVEHRSALQNAAFADSLALKLMFRREAARLERLERTLCASARFVWFLAEEDRAVFAAETGPRAAVMPLLHAGAVAPPAGEPSHDVGLIGTWTWEPNLIGLRWFLREVAPFLPRGFRVAVAGRTPSGLEAPSNVALLGRVPDAGRFLAGCRTVALASRAGTGVQLKTIETLQAGLPAVATSLSMRGVATRPSNVVVEDDPRRFAAAAMALVEDVREGRQGRIDGAVFAKAQAAAQEAALAAGLRSLAEGRTRP